MSPVKPKTSNLSANKTVVLKPILSEKAYGLSKSRGVYAFEVPADVNKLQVLSAVRDQFKVNPTRVNISNLKPTTKRTMRKRGVKLVGQTAGVKKAYVSLKKGETLPVYAAIDEAEAKTQQTEAKAKEVAAKTKAKELAA